MKLIKIQIIIFIAFIYMFFGCKTSVSKSKETTIQNIDSIKMKKLSSSNFESLVSELQRKSKEKLLISFDSFGKKMNIFQQTGDFALMPFGDKIDLDYFKSTFGNVFKSKIDTIVDHGDSNPIIGTTLTFNNSRIQFYKKEIYFADIQDTIIMLKNKIHVGMFKATFFKLFFKDFPKEALIVDTVVFDHGFLENSLDFYFTKNKLTKIKFTNFPD